MLMQCHRNLQDNEMTTPRVLFGCALYSSSCKEKPLQWPSRHFFTTINKTIFSSSSTVNSGVFSRSFFLNNVSLNKVDRRLCRFSPYVIDELQILTKLYPRSRGTLQDLSATWSCPSTRCAIGRN